MKKDIHIPKVAGVEIAIVLDKNEIDNSDEWVVYIINRKEVALEMVVIVSQGFSETKKTSLFIGYKCAIYSKYYRYFKKITQTTYLSGFTR